MALAAICDAIKTRLATIEGVTVLDQPLPQLPTNRMLVVYPNIGTTRPHAHRGQNGGAVVDCRDTIIVEWHLKIAMDQLPRAIVETLPMLDACRDALWSGFVQGAFKASGLTLLHAVDTETFGELGWGADSTFGFRLRLDITSLTEVTAA